MTQRMPELMQVCQAHGHAQGKMLFSRVVFMDLQGWRGFYAEFDAARDAWVAVRSEFPHVNGSMHLLTYGELKAEMNAWLAAYGDRLVVYPVEKLGAWQLSQAFLDELRTCRGVSSTLHVELDLVPQKVATIKRRTWIAFFRLQVLASILTGEAWPVRLMEHERLQLAELGRPGYGAMEMVPAAA